MAVLVLGLVLAACTRGNDGGGPGGGPGGPGGPEGEPGEPGAQGGGGGEFAAPTLVAPEGTQCTLVPGADQPPGWGVGDPVMVKGTFTAEGIDIDAGMMLLEVVPAGSKGETIYHFICGDRSTFEVALPANMGEVALVAFLDVSGDGPVGDDPRGRHPDMLSIESDSIEGVAITLSVGADLGNMAPAFPDEPPDSGKTPEMPPEPDAGDAPPSDHVAAPDGAPGGPSPVGTGVDEPAPDDGLPTPTTPAPAPAAEPAPAEPAANPAP